MSDNMITWNSDFSQSRKSIAPSSGDSVLITFSTVLGLLITSILSAYAFAKIDFPGRDTYFFIILATMMIPEVVTIMPWVLIIRGDVFPAVPYLLPCLILSFYLLGRAAWDWQ